MSSQSPSSSLSPDPSPSQRSDPSTSPHNSILSLSPTQQDRQRLHLAILESIQLLDQLERRGLRHDQCRALDQCLIRLTFFALHHDPGHDQLGCLGIQREALERLRIQTSRALSTR